MAYKIEIEDKAKQDFAKLDGSIKKQIAKFIDKLALRDNPRTLGKRLSENLSNYWSYRVGDYRLVAEIIDNRLVILMLAIAHRKDVYKIATDRTD